MNNEINKYLTEAIGECWHERTYTVKSPPVEPCCHCGSFEGNLGNFFTWQGFGKLWEWATKQEWWNDFLYYECGCHLDAENMQTIINPTNLANAIYGYLKDKDNG